MLRPPPLQLKLDNRFPYPLKSAKPAKSKSSFVSQLYKANWKNPIIAVAALNALRFALAAYNAFQDAAVDDLEEADNLFLVSIALGAMYMIASVVEIYGVIGVSMQRLSIIRLYVYITLFASVLVIGAGVLNGVSYFAFAEELVWECVSLATEGRGYRKSLFVSIDVRVLQFPTLRHSASLQRSRPWPASVFPLKEHDAHRQCVYAWVHQSWSQITSAFLFGIIPAVVYFILVYAYYQQTINPNHSACLINNIDGGEERRHHRSAVDGRTQTYSRVGYVRVAGSDVASTRHVDDDVSSRNGMTTSRLEHALNLLSPRRRPQGAKSLRGLGAAGLNKKPPFVPRSLKRDHRPPPLIQSPSPVGLSPGPPTYGPSRVYAAFAAPVESTEYDRFI